MPFSAKNASDCSSIAILGASDINEDHVCPPGRKPFPNVAVVLSDDGTLVLMKRQDRTGIFRV